MEKNENSNFYGKHISNHPKSAPELIAHAYYPHSTPAKVYQTEFDPFSNSLWKNTSQVAYKYRLNTHNNKQISTQHSIGHYDMSFWVHSANMTSNTKTRSIWTNFAVGITPPSPHTCLIGVDVLKTPTGQQEWWGLSRAALLHCLVGATNTLRLTSRTCTEHVLLHCTTLQGIPQRTVGCRVWRVHGVPTGSSGGYRGVWCRQQ